MKPAAQHFWDKTAERDAERARHATTVHTTFSSNEVARLAGVSLRQLQWWDERGVISPRHDGHRRLYSRQEVIEILVLARLRERGLSLQKMRRLMIFVRRSLKSAGTHDLYLVTDGRSQFIDSRMDHIIPHLENAKCPMYLINIGALVERVPK